MTGATTTMIHQARGSLAIRCASMLLLALLAVSLCACAPSPKEKAEELFESGDYAGAVEEALNISNEDEKAEFLEKVMLTAMDGQAVLDNATLGTEALTGYIQTFSDNIKNQLREFMLSSDTEFTMSFETDPSDADFAAAVEAGEEIKGIFGNYKSIMSTEAVEALGDSGKKLDKEYRELCGDLTSLLSSTGITDIVTSKDVLGTSVTTKNASINLTELKNNVSRFTTEYNSALKAQGE